jgi:hypothetical protein
MAQGGLSGSLMKTIDRLPFETYSGAVHRLVLTAYLPGR